MYQRFTIIMLQMAQLATISNLSSISNEDNVNLRVCVIGVLQETSIPWGKKIEVVIADSTGATKLVWFNPSEGQLEKLKGEMPVALFDIIKKPTELVGTRKSKIIALSSKFLINIIIVFYLNDTSPVWPC